MTAAKTEHRIRWFVYVGEGADRVKIPRQSTMRGLWAYDVECSCGWKTNTGGGTRTYVAREVWYHKHIETGED